MPRRRRAYLHVGLDDGSGDVVDAALGAHAHALLDLGVRRPYEAGEEMFRAAIEVLGTHADWGYQRAEVDGAWRRVAKRARQGRDTIVLSQPLLAAAGREQARGVVAGLDPFEVHAVVTVRAPDAWTAPQDPARDLASVLDHWGEAVRSPDRVHVVLGEDRAATWQGLGRVAGFGTTSVRAPSCPPVHRLPVPASRAGALSQVAHAWSELLASSPYDVVGDVGSLQPHLETVESAEKLAVAACHALGDARHELERLTRRNEELERRLATPETKRRKLKRRLSKLG